MHCRECESESERTRTLGAARIVPAQGDTPLCYARPGDLVDADLCFPGGLANPSFGFSNSVNVGFAPTICDGIGSGQSYCYDPMALEELADRG